MYEVQLMVMISLLFENMHTHFWLFVIANNLAVSSLMASEPAGSSGAWEPDLHRSCCMGDMSPREDRHLSQDQPPANADPVPHFSEEAEAAGVSQGKSYFREKIPVTVNILKYALC